MILLGAIIAFIYGSAIGSFLNVIIWRMPRNESITGRSHCAKCLKQLKAIHLIPLVSYLALGRRCASCGEPISSRYFIIELITGLLFVWVWLQLGPMMPLDYVLVIRDLFITSVLVAVFV